MCILYFCDHLSNDLALPKIFSYITKHLNIQHQSNTAQLKNTFYVTLGSTVFTQSNNCVIHLHIFSNKLGL